MPFDRPEMRQIIIDGYAKGTPIREIARLAGTTYDSCRTTASRLRLVHPNRGQRGQHGKVLNEPWEPAPERVSPQHANWHRAKQAAAEALKAFQ